MNAIEVQKISKSYKEKVVDEIEFTVERGSIFGLLGPNGAGKSTTVRIMSSLAKADEGDVYVEGLSIKEKAVRNQIGYVAQKTAVNLAFTARENLMLQGRLYGLKSGALRERVNYLLNQFDLEKSANKLAAKFSGGMQRKLDLAMGLIHGPSVLFLDEPTTGLDPEARASLWKQIIKLKNDSNLTVVLTTHYLEEADALADQLLIIDNGKAVVQGSPQQLKKQLQGEALEFQLANEEETVKAKAALTNMEVAKRSIVNGAVLHVSVHNASSQLSDILTVLETAGCSPRGIALSKPTLDDVYLLHTGKHYHEKEAIR